MNLVTKIYHRCSMGLRSGLQADQGRLDMKKLHTDQLLKGWLLKCSTIMDVSAVFLHI